MAPLELQQKEQQRYTPAENVSCVKVKNNLLVVKAALTLRSRVHAACIKYARCQTGGLIFLFRQLIFDCEVSLRSRAPKKNKRDLQESIGCVWNLFSSTVGEDSNLAVRGLRR